MIHIQLKVLLVYNFGLFWEQTEFWSDTKKKENYVCLLNKSNVKNEIKILEKEYIYIYKLPKIYLSIPLHGWNMNREHQN